MVLGVPRPTSRSDSANHQFQARVPSDLQERLRGRQAVLTLPSAAPDAPEMIVTATFGAVVKFSLRTTDRVVAANRNSAAVSQLAALYASVRNGPAQPHARETIAYSGEVTACWGARIAVAGLNPHAGEGGLFGDEEIRIIATAVAAARAEGGRRQRPLAGRHRVHPGAQRTLRHRRGAIP